MRTRVHSVAHPIGFVSTLAILLGYTSPLASAASFTPIGFMPGTDHQEEVDAISADGKVVVGDDTVGFGSSYLAFRWSAATGIQPLGDLPGGLDKSLAAATSADGSVIVGASDSTSGYQAYRWTAATGMVGLGDLPGGPFYSFARGVSADGSVVAGGSRSSNSGSSGFEAYRWTQSTGMIGLGDLAGGGFNSNGLAISADGSTIVGYGQTSAANPEAFRWTAANGIVGLGVLPSGISIAGAVSADGSVVIGTDNGAPSASFRWTQADGLQVLTNAGQDMNSNAIAVSGDGSLVGGIDYDSPNGVSVKGAFLWDSVHGERLLKDILTGSGVDLSGWFLYDVTGISADGAIVTGEAVNADSEIEGFVANLVPEPSTLLLAAVGLAGLYFRR